MILFPVPAVRPRLHSPRRHATFRTMPQTCPTSVLARFCMVLMLSMALLLPASARGAEPASVPAAPPADEPPQEKQFVELELELDAYYTNIGLFLALTKTPIPHVGEKTEKEIYTTLLRRAYAPRFLVLEASVNPLPYLGTYIREDHRDFYDDARVSGSFNWVKAVTAGFEEPYAVSAFLGNVVDFDVPENKKIRGKGFSGLLYSTGTYHIKDNVLVRDDWEEIEWKVKGDWKTPDRKLSWSFRVGLKLHDNPDITDIYYLSFRRSRLDFDPRGQSVFNNSGFEYTVDLERGTLTAIRHYFYVDKKWPFEGKKMAFALAMGFVWESARKYSGALAAGSDAGGTQIILRPNIEF
jgi:hypothetical protein